MKIIYRIQFIINNMKNIIIDENNFEDEISKLLLSKKLSFDSSSKYFIYSINKNEELSNVIIKMPPIRLIYNYSNQIFNQVNFPINPSYSRTNKFINLINSIENKLQELLNKPKLEWISNLKKIKNIKNIKLNYNDKNLKIISDNVTNIKEFETGSEIEIVIHLSHLWLKEKRVGVNYDIVQIKYEPVISIYKQNFFGKVKITKTEISENKEEQIKERENNVKKLKLILSDDTLKKQISLLKAPEN